MSYNPSIYAELYKIMPAENRGIKILIYANFYANHPRKYALFWEEMTKQQNNEKLHKPSIYGNLKGFENLWKKR